MSIKVPGALKITDGIAAFISDSINVRRDISASHSEAGVDLEIQLEKLSLIYKLVVFPSLPCCIETCRIGWSS